MAGAAINDHPYGLSADHLGILTQILGRSPRVEEAILFGSRAKGNYKQASDIDLAVKGSLLQKDDIAALFSEFEESLLPFFVDVIPYAFIRNKELADHIDRIGICIYKRNDK